MKNDSHLCSGKKDCYLTNRPRGRNIFLLSKRHLIMEKEQRPRRPRIGENKGFGSRDGSNERYEKVNYNRRDDYDHSFGNRRSGDYRQQGRYNNRYNNGQGYNRNYNGDGENAYRNYNRTTEEGERNSTRPKTPSATTATDTTITTATTTGRTTPKATTATTHAGRSAAAITARASRITIRPSRALTAKTAPTGKTTTG